MHNSHFSAISPVDGRYYSQCNILSNYFSEAALIKYRVIIEIEYFIALCNIPLPQLNHFDKNKFETIRNIYKCFSDEFVNEIKEIEKTTNHDVKSVEYFLRTQYDSLGIGEYKEFIHFGLTSQDINNTAIPLSLKESYVDILKPLLKKVVEKLIYLANLWKHIPMLAYTHGQAASPTLTGKELYVFAERINKQMEQLSNIPFSAKFSGATGNFNAHKVAFPDIDWLVFSDNFVNNTLGLDRSQNTTQIEHYDNLAAFFDCFKRINNIIIDLNRDIWIYISMNYLKQKINNSEVGSSTMPHKVNPIDFENSEGNLGYANAIFEFLAAKLPVSRLQRDLTDSTVLRNIGMPFAHSIIAYNSLLRGLDKITINEEKIKNDLNSNWAVIAEAILTVLRRESYPEPYEALKALTRTGNTINQKTITDFISKLNLSDDIKNELKKITPYNYTGIINF